MKMYFQLSMGIFQCHGTLAFRGATLDGGFKHFYCLPRSLGKWSSLPSPSLTRKLKMMLSKAGISKLSGFLNFQVQNVNLQGCNFFVQMGWNLEPPASPKVSTFHALCSTWALKHSTLLHWLQPCYPRDCSLFFDVFFGCLESLDLKP